MRNSIIQINQVYSNGRVQSLGYPPFKTLTKVQISRIVKATSGFCPTTRKGHEH